MARSAVSPGKIKIFAADSSYEIGESGVGISGRRIANRKAIMASTTIADHRVGLIDCGKTWIVDPGLLYVFELARQRDLETHEHEAAFEMPPMDAARCAVYATAAQDAVHVDVGQRFGSVLAEAVARIAAANMGAERAAIATAIVGTAEFVSDRQFR